jgi:hypothetical protein
MEAPMFPTSKEALIETARARGLHLDAQRAERLVPLLESLLGRLSSLSESLPRETAPPPTRLERAPLTGEDR